MVQSQFQAEGLKLPEVTIVSLHCKAEEIGVSWPHMMVEGADSGRSLHPLDGFLLFPL
jgi:hypothetical protein